MRKRSAIHVQSPLETETFLRVYKWAATQTVTMNQIGTELGGGHGWWQGIWEWGKPPTVHPVLSAFLICVFSESALAKFSRKPSTKYSLGLQGRHSFPPSDLDKSGAWKQENPDVSVMKQSRGGPTCFQKSPATGDYCLPLTPPVLIWPASLALEVRAQWPSSSVWGCFLPPSGPQGTWSKALSAQKVGFLLDASLKQGKMLHIVLSLLSSWLNFWGGGGPQCQQKISLVGPFWQKCFHHIVSFTKWLSLTFTLSWLLFLAMGYF